MAMASPLSVVEVSVVIVLPGLSELSLSFVLLGLCFVSSCVYLGYGLCFWFLSFGANTLSHLTTF